MSGFLYKTDRQTKQGTDPDGNPATITTYPDRGLKPLDNEMWDDPEQAAKVLGLILGDARKTKNNNIVRDVYFAKVQGPTNPRTGKPYARNLLGRLVSGVTQNEETGEMHTWWRFFAQESQDTRPSTPQSAPQTQQDDTGSDSGDSEGQDTASQQEEAQEATESI